MPILVLLLSARRRSYWTLSLPFDLLLRSLSEASLWIRRSRTTRRRPKRVCRDRCIRYLKPLNSVNIPNRCGSWCLTTCRTLLVMSLAVKRVRIALRIIGARCRSCPGRHKRLLSCRSLTRRRKLLLREQRSRTASVRSMVSRVILGTRHSTP